MKTIDRLIEELCPDGVEYKRLEDVSEIGTGSYDRKEACENGLYPFYVRSREILSINKYLYDEEAIIIPGEGGIGDIFHYAKGKYGLHQRAYRIHFTDSRVNTLFAYYYMQSNFKRFIFSKAVNATVTSIRKPMIEMFEIPVPPIEVQQKIVEILDNFTNLIAELEAELEARKKQYEYYRNELLTFTPPYLLNEVKCLKMGEIAFYSKERVDCGLLNRDNYISVENLLRNKLGKIPAESFPLTGKVIRFQQGDILIGNIRPYLKKIWKADCEGGTNGDVLCIRLKEKTMLPDFFFYVLSSDKFFEYDNSFSKGGKMPRGDKKAILNYSVPIFPLNEQHRIVNILDKFEALVNKELPAEIEARKQQYEYYRNKLLDFKQSA